MKKEIFGFDAFSPSEIAERIENIGVVKARLPLLSMIMLGILAGSFIALGAMFYTLVISDAGLSFAAGRILGGLVFSLGLLMVIVAGAELFTGNNLLVMAWADGHISGLEVIRNWTLVSLSNLIGAVGVAVIVFLSGHLNMANGAVENSYVKISIFKCNIEFVPAFFSGMLCNILVCLSVWMSQAGRSVTDKFVVIVAPITAFVACGFEHSIANMYFIPMGLLIKNFSDFNGDTTSISLMGMLQNLLPVVLGNLAGGAGFVSLFYYFIYKRSAFIVRSEPPNGSV
ncbi:MAG: formate/nitrite transporter family protein [Saprospiraceae bacterium]|nr:formate/nitrite transporter family protein [Saprospiraceae bacterium]HMW39159.1 formate/nitrite transporter family protein [Saprospiraceae bacterium]HMX88740.1 formate/nitrite transporter family protein [Saprospiraceae bacterium]HMZ38872.1 formate/nitrite transporter family protein [Saprospiraceae bacterium]HNA64498.1 formate/nitrite transporter family protein [Saprospiraceae bacterium]